MAFDGSTTFAHSGMLLSEKAAANVCVCVRDASRRQNWSAPMVVPCSITMDAHF